MHSVPVMPTLSQPSIGSGFYMPGRSDFYSGKSSKTSKETAAAKSESTDSSQNNQGQTTSSVTEQIPDSVAKVKSLIQNQNINSLSSTETSPLNQLTASDISSLGNLGMLGSLGSLLGKSTSANSPAQNSLASSSLDSLTLQKILSELTSLKNQVAKNGVIPSSGDNFSNKGEKSAKILRFIVNGYDLLSGCRKIYFSEEETDGTFLLTGDRKYISDNKSKSETFYFYFHASGSQNGMTKYRVTPAVSQVREDPQSLLFQLTQKEDVTASRTGNLVTLRVNEESFKMDLLISMDK